MLFGMKKPLERHIFEICTFLIMGVVAAFSITSVKTGIHILSSVRVTYVSLIVFSLVTAVYSIRSLNLHKTIDALRQAWPLLAMCIVDIIFFRYSYLNQSASELAYAVPLRMSWLIGNTISSCTLISAYYVGTRIRKVSDSAIATFLLITSAAIFFTGLAQFLDWSGHATFLGNWISNFDAAQRGISGRWAMSAVDFVRARGLDAWPAHFAFPSISFLAWSLSARALPVRRSLVAILAIGIVTLSGARSVGVAIGIVLLVHIIHLTTKGTISKWMKSGGALVTLALIIALLAALFAGQTQWGKGTLFGRMNLEDNVSTVSVSASSKASSQQGTQTQNLLPRATPADNALPSVKETADAALNGRVSIWGALKSTVMNHPLGTGFPSAWSIGVHAHNDMLERFVWGGVALMGVYVAVLVWLGFTPTFFRSDGFGMLVATGCAIAGMSDKFSIQVGLYALPLFLFAVLRDAPLKNQSKQKTTAKPEHNPQSRQR